MGKRKVRINKSVKVESSFIDSLDYSTDDEVMIVNFSAGHQAAYEGITIYTFCTVALHAASVGKEYNRLKTQAHDEEIEHINPINLDDLNIGYFEAPEESLADRFPIGTPVRVSVPGYPDEYPKFGLVAGVRPEYMTGYARPYPVTVTDADGRKYLLRTREVESLV